MNETLILGIASVLLAWSVFSGLLARHNVTEPLLFMVVGYGLALTIGGNGFIAAFVAGIAFGSRLHATAAEAEDTVLLPELGGEVLAMVVWFLFGAGLVPVALRGVSASVSSTRSSALRCFACCPSPWR